MKKEKGQKVAGKEQIDAVKDYCDIVLKKYKEVIKSMWLISSERFEKSRDLTVVILFNDVQKIDHVTKKKVEVLTIEAERKVEKKHRISIHPTFYLLSDYWELIRHGSPVTFSEIREGIPVYDPSGFFVPIKKLLSQGRIPGTKEAMRSLIAKAPLRIRRVKYVSKARIVESVYNAVIDAGQAPLILKGVAPPAQKDVALMLKIHFVKNKALEPEYVRYCEEIVRYWKDYEHGKVKDIPGDVIDRYLENGVRFVKRMEMLMEQCAHGGVV